MKTLIIDNYDSFTYNLFQYIGELKGNPIVYQNDTLTLAMIKKIAPTHIIISPGPGTVENQADFGICNEVILTLGSQIPMLGICLGHQGIIHAFQGKIRQAPDIVHGKQSVLEHNHSRLFSNVPTPFPAMRYHSLCGDKNLPKELKITAWIKGENTVMAIEHFEYPLFGVQFHPESFMTPHGKQIMKNFLLLQID
jgi:anthranilate synthase component 2